MKECNLCDGPMPPLSPPYRKYCSKKCLIDARYKRGRMATAMKRMKGVRFDHRASA